MSRDSVADGRRAERGTGKHVTTIGFRSVGATRFGNPAKKDLLYCFASESVYLSKLVKEQAKLVV